MAYVEDTYKSITYHKWDMNGEAPDGYLIKIDWKSNYMVEDLEGVHKMTRITPIGSKPILGGGKKLVKDFVLVGKSIDRDILLDYFSFSGRFCIHNCDFKKPLHIEFSDVHERVDISCSAFNSFTFNCNLIVDDIRFYKNTFTSNFKIDTNIYKYLNLTNNKFARGIKIDFTNSGTDNIEIDAIEFINHTTRKHVSHQAYFKGIKKYVKDWKELRISFRNFKDYYLSKNDNISSKIFEWLENRAYDKEQWEGHSWLGKLGLSIKHLLNNSFKRILSISTVSLIIAILAYLNITPNEITKGFSKFFNFIKSFL